MYPESTQSLLNVHRAFWLCLKSVFAFCMVEGIMPPANLHGESTPDFIVRMYIECTFDFIEACQVCLNYGPQTWILDINVSQPGGEYCDHFNDPADHFRTQNI